MAAASLTAPGFTASLTAPSVAGITVTPQTALTYTAYYAAVKIISEDLAGLPLLHFQRKGGHTKVVEDSRINLLFARTPDGEAPAFTWRESYFSHGLGWGNGYAEIAWDNEGQIKGLLLIHPALIQPKRDNQTGQLFYELSTADSSISNGTLRRLRPWQVLHMANTGFNGLVGYSPVALAREAVGVGKAAEQFSAAFFGNGAWAGGALEHAGQLKMDARKNLRESINLVHQGSASAFKFLLLEEGMKFTPITIPAQDAQMLETRRFQVLEICRIFRLPPHKLADLTDAHYDNMEELNEDYIVSCLRPWAQRFESAANFKLLTRAEFIDGHYIKHDFRPLWLRTSKDKADYYQKMFQIGYYTVDEIKALEGDDPIGEAAGGQKRFVMSNLADITVAGDPGKASQAKEPDGEPGRPPKRNGHNHRLEALIWPST